MRVYEDEDVLVHVLERIIVDHGLSVAINSHRNWSPQNFPQRVSGAATVEPGPAGP